MPEEKMQEFSEQNLSEGYCIKITVKPDGFSVSDPKPIEEDEYNQSDEMIPDLTAMLKNVMAVIQENPLEGSESEGFDESETSPATPQAY